MGEGAVLEAGAASGLGTRLRGLIAASLMLGGLLMLAYCDDASPEGAVPRPARPPGVSTRGHHPPR